MDLSVALYKHKYKIAFGFFLAYLCLTMYKIGQNSLWYDECFSIDLGNDTIDEIMHYSLYSDTNPPFYLLLMHYWMQLFGNSELALRSVSAISGSIACGMFFLLSLRFFNWQTAVFVMLLYFTSNELYYYSEEGRTYGIILMLCVLSNYTFLRLVEKPNWIIAILLGLLNITIFYTHTLGCINIVGQVFLACILPFKKERLFSKSKTEYTFLGFQLSFVVWYIYSWIIFWLCFWPWKKRFYNILFEDGTKGFWLQKPTIVEYKQVLYDFYNSDYLFYTYLSVTLILLLVLLIFKKTREPIFNYKLILIPVILGPVLYHFNFFAASITPIFLKRYVLFTLLGFILLFAYLLASLKINFKLKFALILILACCSAYKMKVPREPYWDYKSGTALIKSKVSPTTYITTDNPMLLSYYFDREGAFKAYQVERDKILAKSNIFSLYDLDWPVTTDFSKYTDIYYTRSFDDYSDPSRITETKLKERFVFLKDTFILGIKISHYSTRIPGSELNRIKGFIIKDATWYAQIKEKAKLNNVSIDSMVTTDAMWYYKNSKTMQK